jgi:CubicO group peptidase (beta-lactamase class C family)
MYFPPNTGNEWQTIAPENLGWNINEINALYSYLEAENTKAFIVLKDGKIVLERYFDTFRQDSIWYWASAGKTITSFLIGQSTYDGKLSLNDISSKYLGKGWTSMPADKEDKITIWNQITMTSGLDDGVADNHCTADTCLIYKADAGTRWAYHNAPYTLLDNVLEQATGSTMNQLTRQKLLNSTGISGLWVKVDEDNVFFSRPRMMARWGHLFLNNCIWNGDTVLKDRQYFANMISTSQNLNKSYGYLWWLNGKETYMLPTLQNIFKGSMIPQGPPDMYMGLGKNGQIVSIIPSMNMVLVRMGDRPSTPAAEIGTVLLNEIWIRMNRIMSTAGSVQENSVQNARHLYPIPARDILHAPAGEAMIYNIHGQQIWSGTIDASGMIDIHAFPDGVYILKSSNSFFRFVILQ